MYVTRPLSLYKKNPEALTLPPPEGPNSGVLVIQDEELEPTSCFGFGEFHEVKELPFPQNLNLELFYRSGISLNRTTHYRHVAFIPVLNQPLSSNKYYAIQLNGKKRGDAYINSKEEDLDTFCFYNSVSDEPLHPIDISNTQQEFEIYPRRSKVTFRSGFSATSVAPDGYPPRFLSRRWKVSASKTSSDSSLGEAAGVNEALRANKPEFQFPLANKTSESVVVGKWYCPFMFIKEGTHKTLKEEVRKSMFYEVTLEQKWEQLFSCENEDGMGKNVNVDAVVQKEMVVINGWEAVMDHEMDEGIVWFHSFNNVGEKNSVGLNMAIVERMKWEQERVGWIGGKEKEIRIRKVEEFEGTNKGWKKFGCYVLVETFVVKRLDGSLVLSYAFKHHHQLRSKWE